MDSSTSRADQERRKQEDLRRQISELQAQLTTDISQDAPPCPPPVSPTRKRPGSNLLVPPTPSPSEGSTFPLVVAANQSSRETQGESPTKEKTPYRCHNRTSRSFGAPAGCGSNSRLGEANSQASGIQPAKQARYHKLSTRASGYHTREIVWFRGTASPSNQSPRGPRYL